MRYDDKTLVVIGGGSGIGLATAKAFVEGGGQVVIGGRSLDRLETARERLGPNARAAAVDLFDPASVARFFALVDRIDHLFTPAATYTIAPFDHPDEAALASPFDGKFWGQVRCVRAAAPKLSPDGSVVLMSGAASARPPKGAALYAAANGAIEAFGRGLAVDLAPIRVNVIAPGTIDGDFWARRPAEVRDAAFAGQAAGSLAGRPGTEAEIAQAVLFLLTNGFTTGTTLFTDGGYSLR
ncbi:short-chain dehydrogenase [Caulobacter zeae]|uniref:Short-chain dehydrogenase n=1 Tax=Caulobacter zeae TaxID=2055137 RepID=A0A2N5DNW4_9CAUL|nr:SDR family oxidoreductase [Caulobacter zeae]PLR27753.1 short-chain dehydrogenase [Caulobacter zeae]